MTELHLLFTHVGVRYVLNADQVSEIVWLPELSAVPDASPWVIGAFNLRGRVVPVLDLSLCFGHGRAPLNFDNVVVVSEVAGERFGLLAGAVLDAIPISPADIEDVHAHRELLAQAAPLMRGVAMLAQELAMVIDAPALLGAAALARDTFPQLDSVVENLNERDAELLHTRARGMALMLKDSGDAGTEQFALLRIDTELFGIRVCFVREFMRLGTVWPVPCCPPHILGSMNVRGDILTVVDPRPVFGLATSVPPAEVAVLKVGSIRFGLAVGAVLDVAPAEGLGPLAAAGDRREWEFCSGTASSDGRVFSIIDIESLLTARVLHVAERTVRKNSGPTPAGSFVTGER